jgi:putative peptidoglycan lipid II flippase
MATHSFPVTPASSPGGDRQGNIARSAGVVSAAVLMSRITGLVRESVMAAVFGASQSYDAYVLGFRIPNLMRDLFAEGGLSAAFVPIFTRYLTTRSREEAARLFNLVATAIMMIVGALCVLGVAFSPQLVDLFAHGFRQVPGKYQLAVRLTRIMFPFLLLVALAAQAMGVLNACRKFAVPALSSVMFNVGSVTLGLILGFVLGPHLGIQPIYGMACGVVMGGALQVAFQIPSLVRTGFAFRPAIDFQDEGLRNVLRLMGPALLGSASTQINILVNTNFAAALRDASGMVMNGPVSWLNYAFRFMQFPLGVFGVAIAAATLPEIARSAARNDLREFRDTLSRSLSMVMVLTIPSSIGLAVLGPSIVGAIYQYHKFTAFDTQQTAMALSCYAAGLAGYASVKVLVPAFYSLNDARTPMLVSLFSVAVNFAVASYMVRTPLRHAGLALATSSVSIASFLLLLLVLRRTIGEVNGGELFSTFWRTSAASVAMGALCFTSSRLIHAWLGMNHKAAFADLAISIPLSAGVCFAFCKILGVSGIDWLMETALRRFRIRC